MFYQVQELRFNHLSSSRLTTNQSKSAVSLASGQSSVPVVCVRWDGQLLPKIVTSPHLRGDSKHGGLNTVQNRT
jgi:hypothetical protein